MQERDIATLCRPTYRRSQRFIERVFAAISGSRHYYRAARYVVQLISAVHA